VDCAVCVGAGVDVPEEAGVDAGLDRGASFFGMALGFAGAAAGGGVTAAAGLLPTSVA